MMTMTIMMLGGCRSYTDKSQPSVELYHRYDEGDNNDIDNVIDDSDERDDDDDDYGTRRAWFIVRRYCH